MQIYGIYVYWQESVDTPYLLAVSCSEETLKTMLKNLIEEYKHEYEINDYVFDIELVTLYVVTKCENGNLKLNKTIHYNEEFLKNNIYGMNYLSANLTKQVLLKISHEAEESSLEYQLFLEDLRNHELFKENDFSSNSIEFDKYYDESILNA